MSRARRVLSTGLIAATLAAGLAPLTAQSARAADPDGTVTLASGLGALQAVPRVLTRTTTGTVLEDTAGDGTVLRGVFVPDNGSAPVVLPWLAAVQRAQSVDNIVSGVDCTGTCHVVWHTVPSGPSGSSATPIYVGDYVGAAPGGWVESAVVSGQRRLVRVDAATGTRTDLGYPGTGSYTGYTSVGDAAGLAVLTSSPSTIWYTPWDAPGQFRQVLTPASGSARLWQTLAGAVLFEQPSPGNGASTLVRSEPDGHQTTVSVDWVGAAAMTATQTAYEYQQQRVAAVPAAGGQPTQLYDAVGWAQQLSGLFSDGRTLTVVEQTVDDSGVAGLVRIAGEPPTYKTVYVAPRRPLTARQVALGGGRVAWTDDSVVGPGVRERTLTGDTSLSLGTPLRLPAPVMTFYGLSVSGRRTVYTDDNNRGVIHRVGDSGVTTLPTDRTPSISGTRVATGSAVTDLVTGTSTPVPAADGLLRIWGHRAVYELASGELRQRDLSTGADTQLVPAPTNRNPYTPFAIWGDTLAWHDGQLRHEDLRTGVVTTVPGTNTVSAAQVEVSGSWVGFIDATPSAHLYPLSSDGPEVTIGPLRPSAVPLETSMVSLDGSRVGWVDAAGLPKVTPLPHIAEAPRYLGNPFAPSSFVPADGPWHGEWVFTKPLPNCTVTIRSGTATVRTLGCATTTGSALASWDGTDAAGHVVAPGSYTWTVSASDADGPALAEDGTSAPIAGSVVVHAVSRVAGIDRFATSAAVSKATYAAGTPVAYVANGLAFPDALSAAPAAGHQRGPVLLTQAGSLPAPIATELARLKPKRIVVLGSPSAVSAAVATRLKGYTTGTVTRLAGADRFATSAAVSKATYAAGTPVAYVASGLAFPDALSAAPAAGHLGGPVLLTKPGALPSAIATELARLKPRRIVVLGSTSAVSSTVATRLKSYTTGTVTRLAGSDRFATSAAISQATYPAGVPVAYVANGLAFPDALSGAPAGGTQAGPVLLTQPGSLPTAIATELARLRPGRIVVLGSTAAVSAATVSRLTAYTK